MLIPLRTLLAYLDDMLEPEEARRIGQKIAEDDTARELLARIKQVTRRRRLTTPPADHPANAKMDPNTIAAYLENTLPAEQQEEIEQICLTSDVHLAEVAACHQLLTALRSEPAKVPPTARERMYGLAKGPEAIPFRKAPMRETSPPREPLSESKETDETLRLGLPPFQAKGWQNNLVLVGGALAAGFLLVVAIYQILNLSGSKEQPDSRLAQGNGLEKQQPAETSKEQKKGLPPKKEETPEPGKKAPEKKEPVMIEPPKPDPGKTEPIKKEPIPLPSAPPGPPTKHQIAVGNLLPPASGDLTILLQLIPDHKEWKRLAALKNPEVYSGRSLVSLPGCRSTIQLNRDVRLTLWGNLPEQMPLPILESKVELHHHEKIDLDLTLFSGRIVVQNTRPDKPALVRVRFENPTVADSQEFFDIVLLDKGAEVLLDRIALIFNEPFYKDPKHPNRLGPAATMGVVVLAGNISLKSQDVTFAMQAPPGPAMLVWESRKGINGPHVLPKIPEGLITPPPGLDIRTRTDMLRARDDLGKDMSTLPVETALAQALQSDNPFRRVLAVRCQGALGDLPSLVDTLSDEKHADVRQTGVQNLRHWLATGRDNDYLLLEALRRTYKQSEAEKIIELLHGLTDTELLVDYLISPTLALRELAITNLMMLRPDGRNLGYSPVADAAAREKAYSAWRELIKKPPPPPPSK